MVNAVTTTDLLLQEISTTLTQVRDLLQEQRPTEQPATGSTPIKEPAAKKPAAKRAGSRTKKS